MPTDLTEATGLPATRVTCSAEAWVANADQWLTQAPIRRVVLSTWPIIHEKADPVRLELVGRGPLDSAMMLVAFSGWRGVTTKGVLEAEWPGIDFTVPAGPDPYQKMRAERLLRGLADAPVEVPAR